MGSIADVVPVKGSESRCQLLGKVKLCDCAEQTEDQTTNSPQFEALFEQHFKLSARA